MLEACYSLSGEVFQVCPTGPGEIARVLATSGPPELMEKVICASILRLLR